MYVVGSKVLSPRSGNLFVCCTYLSRSCMLYRSAFRLSQNSKVNVSSCSAICWASLVGSRSHDRTIVTTVCFKRLDNMLHLHFGPSLLLCPCIINPGSIPLYEATATHLPQYPPCTKPQPLTSPSILPVDHNHSPPPRHRLLSHSHSPPSVFPLY